MNVKGLARTGLKRRELRGDVSGKRPTLRFSILDSPVSIGRRPAGAPHSRASQFASMELELGGMGVEFKAKTLSGLLGWLALDLACAAVIQELMRPRQFRTWHGRIAGLVPYDFRRPTLSRMLAAIWAPDNPRLFTDTAFGVGWSLNLAQLVSGLRGSRAGTPAVKYQGPRVQSSGS